MAEDLQTLPPFYVQISGPTHWVLIRQYSDRSAIIQTFGPFPTEHDAEGAEELLRETLNLDGFWEARQLHQVIPVVGGGE